jgi:lysozyme family protein
MVGGMMANFDVAISIVLRHEGHGKAGVVHTDKGDPGGLTNSFGFALKENPDLTEEQIRNMTKEEALARFRARYWSPLHDQLADQRLANALLDASVNQGLSTAVRILQLALMELLSGPIALDSRLGPHTIEAANAVRDPDELLKKFCTHRILSYTHDSCFSKAKESWINRSLDW